MVDIINSLKNRARILQRQIRSHDRDVLKRLAILKEFAGKNPGEIAASVRRRHCLTVIAREAGFANWTHVVQVMSGAENANFGKLLYSSKCGVHINIWAASYDEAKDIHMRHGGYLLPYQTQYLVVEESYIRTLGLDPDATDWDRMGRDWVRPRDMGARSRFYAQLI